MKYKATENEKNNIFKKVNELSEDIFIFAENLKNTHNQLNL